MRRIELLIVLVAFCSAGARAETVVVSDEQANVLHVIVAPDWKTVVDIPVGRRPRGMALSARASTNPNARHGD